MARDIGIASAQDLFSDIPAALRVDGLRLPEAEPERHMVRRLRTLLGKNQSYERMATFLGGGMKPQLVPAAVKAVAHRQEFITSYTPYQPEVSQGLLQVIFEYQSLMCDITRMEVSNAGMYDGPTALGEAALMCMRANGRVRFLVPAHLSWEKRSILRNYTVGPGIALDTYGFDDKSGRSDLASLRSKLGPDVCVAHSRHISVALRARVVRTVLWHGSSCPRRARLPLGVHVTNTC